MAYEDAPAPARVVPSASYQRPRKRKNEAALARAYAMGRLRMLSQAGLSDQEGDISGLAAAALQSSDPAAAWRALSARMMAVHGQEQGAPADPRAWLAQRAAAGQAQGGVMSAMGAGAPAAPAPQVNPRVRQLLPLLAQARQQQTPAMGALGQLVQRLQRMPGRKPRRGMLVE